MATVSKTSPLTSRPSILVQRMRPIMISATVTIFALMILTVYLSPFGYMVVTGFKNKDALTEVDAPFWPAEEAAFSYEGEEYPMYQVPTEDGQIHKWALYDKGREASLFLDPRNPEAGPIEWTGRWRSLKRDWQFSPRWENFTRAWTQLNIPLLLRNTLAIAIAGSIGTVCSCVAVAYGFSRFRIPGKGAIFTILIATIILPRFVTLVTTYTLFYRIGWVGTWLPLIVPHFFANAYNVFLLRQFFMTIPRELDEAAMIDGAGPLRTLLQIILPQSVSVVIAVGILHFMWAWNDYFEPLIYLSAERDLQPIALGIQGYNSLYGTEPNMVQASSLLGLILPVVLFFLAQRYIMRGVVFTGVEK
ncbi:MAG: carbohydrate ABC transporter permease [Chloroflexi bacterium]|nr:carbohydrate ABC transporter permease [Chloroflexota bacterium]